ncbi:MAG: orotidine-5'-phosphate decarboxylase [Candidatus Omnitrophica bacterium]|nr:orotidine-5'-phosphate decarboxylase [Candidatus Omnitrophota bacterium]
MNARPHRRTVGERLIVALDDSTLRSALAMARRLRGLIRTVKVGSILFTAEGPRAIRALQALGFDVMLDLKFFDIPSTVEDSCRAAVHHRVSLVTIHASGSPAMLDAAVRGIRQEAAKARVPRPTLLGVTVLTSVGDGKRGMSQRVLRLAAAAVAAGCDGVVASAQEARALRRRFGSRLMIVCPGIRLPQTEAGDQSRVATPRAAIAQGADCLVVGRPITTAAHPRQAAQHMLNDMEAAAC